MNNIHVHNFIECLCKHNVRKRRNLGFHFLPTFSAKDVDGVCGSVKEKFLFVCLKFRNVLLKTGALNGILA
jgi:hypothetical protein